MSQIPQGKFEFSLPQTVNMTNVNTRKELHGEEHVQAVDPAPGAVRPEERMTAERIVSMIHPDIPPATAHFLLNEAKPLLVGLESRLTALDAQLCKTEAETAELRLYKASIEPRYSSLKRMLSKALEELAAIKAQEPAYRCQPYSSVPGAKVSESVDYYAAPVAPAQPQGVNAELVEALEELMEWQVKNVKIWHNFAYDNAHAALANAKAAPVQVVPDDFISHKYAWLTALQIARDHALVQPHDIDDKSYWEHEIRAFQNAYSKLETAAPQQEQKGGE